MESINFISQISLIIITSIISLFFITVGIFYSKNFLDLNNYLVANRIVKTISLTMSLVASAQGTWILFGPFSAATWGGIGAVYWICTRKSISFFFVNLLRKNF